MEIIRSAFEEQLREAGIGEDNSSAWMGYPSFAFSDLRQELMNETIVIDKIEPMRHPPPIPLTGQSLKIRR